MPLEVPDVTLPVLLLVSLGPIFGGAESYYAKLVRILRHEYRIVAVVCSKRLAEELQDLGVETECPDHTWGTSSLRRYIFALGACRRMMQRHHPRVAHLNGQAESYLAIFFRLMHIPVLTTRHTPFTSLYLREGSRWPPFLKRWIVLFSLRQAHVTICVSKMLRQQLAQNLPPERLAYIPTWVAEEFLELYKRPLPSTPLKLLFVGRVVRHKGIFEVIEALRYCPQVHLTVVGEGTEMGAARSMADKLPVTFLGFQRDCKPMYKVADLLIFPSPEGFEGLPQVPLEAMAMGLPCLASDISSILEIAGESKVLVTYRQGEVDDLVLELSSLAANPESLVHLGQAGRLEIAKRFAESAVADAVLTQFRATML